MSRGVRALALVLCSARAGFACQARSSDLRSSRSEAGAIDASTPATVECEGILERSWTAIQPALARLRIAPSTLEKDYLGRLGSSFVTSCSSLRPGQRRCIARAKSPPLALETCGINKNRAPADRVALPSLAAHVTLLEPPSIDAREAEQVLVSLIGDWINTGADGQINAVWSFSRDARLRIRERKADAEGEQTFRISFPARHRMALERTEAGKQDVALFRSHDSLYVSRGLSYDVVPLSDRARITLRHETSYVFFGPEGCEVIADNGAVFPARCGYQRRPDGTELFAVRASMPPAPGVAVSYPIVDGHLLHERLASYGRFVRQAGEQAGER